MNVVNKLSSCNATSISCSLERVAIIIGAQSLKVTEELTEQVLDYFSTIVSKFNIYTLC